MPVDVLAVRNAARLVRVMATTARTGKLAWTVPELAEELGLSRPQVRGVLASLAAEGWVQAAADAAGRREHWTLAEGLFALVKTYERLLTDEIDRLQARVMRLQH